MLIFKRLLLSGRLGIFGVEYNAPGRVLDSVTSKLERIEFPCICCENCCYACIPRDCCHSPRHFPQLDVTLWSRFPQAHVCTDFDGLALLIEGVAHAHGRVAVFQVNLAEAFIVKLSNCLNHVCVILILLSFVVMLDEQ